MNNISLIGRLTADIELKTVMDGTSVCNFTLAVPRPHSKSTDFINCVAWGNLAEMISRNTHKGVRIGVNGYLKSRKFQDQDGKNHVAFEVNCEVFDFCETLPKQPGYREGNTEDKSIPRIEDCLPDDVPF